MPSLRPAGRRAPHDVLQIAHRGGNNGVEDYRPANLQRLAGLGTHLVEIDVRVTADMRPVVHHEPWVAVAGGEIDIARYRFTDLARHAAGRVPAAGSVLRAIRAAGLGVYLDIKDITEPALGELVQIMAAAGVWDRAVLASADPDIVDLCASAAPDLPRALLVRTVGGDLIALARAVHADHLHPCWEDRDRPHSLLADGWLSAVRHHRLGVICWHEERSEILSELLHLGVDGICTDDPDLLARRASPDPSGM
jgi:glycerophosphoryl diester phosphodiesterase